MDGEIGARDLKASYVAAYKTILRNVLDQRPSGTRQRLATALGKNRSFVSQISNPAYSVPIPAKHLDAVFEICRTSDRRQRTESLTIWCVMSCAGSRASCGQSNDAPNDREVRMKKLINAPQDLLSESLDGFAAAHREIVMLGEERKFVRRRALTQGKVALISGGGSGHEPLHAGFVGLGMLDAACPGHVFTSPTPDQMVAAAAAVDGGAGTLFIVKNYEGDVMNFEMAAEMAAGKTRSWSAPRPRRAWGWTASGHSVSASMARPGRWVSP